MDIKLWENEVPYLTEGAETPNVLHTYLIPTDQPLPCVVVFAGGGYHFRAPQAEDTRFAFPADDARCAQLTALFAQQKFRRSLANLLPQGGTTHRTQDGDFRWEVGFCFDETDFPDGSTGKGVFVQCRNFFGKMQLFRAYDGKSFRCTVQDQDAFLQQVYGIISSEP